MEKKTDKGFISSRNRPVADQVFKRGRLLIMQDRLLSFFSTEILYLSTRSRKIIRIFFDAGEDAPPRGRFVARYCRNVAVGSRAPPSYPMSFPLQPEPTACYQLLGRRVHQDPDSRVR